MRLLVWAFRALVFFALFAFALNNQHDATVHWFFGRAWHAPMVIVVLIAFALGVVAGVVGMLPSWWRHRRDARAVAPGPAEAPATSLPPGPAAEAVLVHPPRDGL